MRRVIPYSYEFLVCSSASDDPQMRSIARIDYIRWGFRTLDRPPWLGHTRHRHKKTQSEQRLTLLVGQGLGKETV